MPSRTGRTCATACNRPTGAAAASSIRNWWTSRSLDRPGWHADAATAEALRAPLLAAATYFLRARDKSKRVVDPVARCPLGNGARLEQLDHLGDSSANGLKQSHGLMISYLYDPGRIEANHEGFAERSHVGHRTASRPRCPSPPNPESCFTGVTMNANLFDILVRSIANPEAAAIETPAGERISYADLVARTGRMANALAGLGVKPGDRIAAQVEKSVEAIILYLATVRAGAVFLPLNTGYTPAEIDYFIGDAEPAILVCDPVREAELRKAADGAGARILTLDARGSGSLTDAAGAAPADFETVQRDRDDLAALLYTSGTTGRSKGAMLTHGNLVSNALTLRDAWRYSDKDVLIHALPIFHTHGLFVATNVTLFSGASMIFLPKFDVERILAAMARATVLMGVPTFYVRLLEEDRLDAGTTAGMRLFVSGSAPLLAETHREWRARTGHAILERYGMTETNMNTSNPYDGDRVAGTVGFPLPGTEVVVTDPETGAELPQGDIGMIEVRGPNVFKGYWRMPEKTAAELRDNGFFVTGDLGRIDDRGYVHIIGRGKDLIITGGYNVYPKEIETEIDAIPGVLESAVIGIPHKDFGEGVTAVVIPTGSPALTEAQVVAALEDRLARFKQPKRVLFLDELPRNTMGKVQKNLLRDQFAGLYD